jgi:hypothetical protein
MVVSRVAITRELNQYIYEDSRSPVWLQGPTRDKVDVDINPLTYLTWEEQCSVPWQIPDRYVLDTDGNGGTFFLEKIVAFHHIVNYIHFIN